jgi:hypothetical protein
MCNQLLPALLHYSLTPASFSPAGFFFTLLTFRDEVHLLTIGFGDPLSNHNLVKAAQQLIDGFTVASLYSHKIA